MVYEEDDGWHLAGGTLRLSGEEGISITLPNVSDNLVVKIEANEEE